MDCMAETMVQVNSDHYDFLSYVNENRWSSYYYQIKEVLASAGCKCNSLLIIGAGDGIVEKVLSNSDIVIHTFDFDESLNPTYVGDVKYIDRIVKQKYDFVLCCQVLEHLPFELFEDILKSLSAIAEKKVIISLPLQAIKFMFETRISGLPKMRFQLVIEKCWIKKWKYNGEHYWEVGIRHLTRKRIKNLFEKYFEIEKDYCVPYNQYHWFCILKSRKVEING